MTLPDDLTLRFAALPVGDPLPIDVLAPDERATLETFGSAKRRREFALGRAVVRRLLADRLGGAPASIPLCVAEDGAPEVEGTALHVSISHVATETTTLAVAVGAARPVGVDLEQIRPRRPDLYRFLLAPEDYGVLDTLPYDHDEAQVLIWTLKEAVLKGLRTGFRLSPKKLKLVIDAEARRASVAFEGTRWEVRYERRAGCFLAVALLS